MDNVQKSADAMNGRKSYAIDHALVAEARREYATTVDAATTHRAPDGRRVLTTEHCTLKSLIDSYLRGDEPRLREAIDECRRTREMWA